MGGIGLRELVVILVVGLLFGGAIALLFPRRRVPLKVKRIIAWAWIAIGVLQIVIGASYQTTGGHAMATNGLSEVAIFGGALLTFTEKRWLRVIGGCAIFVGVVLMVAAGAMRNSPPH
jgi:hypothetical protein